MARLTRILFGLCLLVAAACQSTLQPNDLDAVLTNPDHTGIRWGLVVADMDGEELLALRPDDRFTPASNTKIITTLAAYHHLEQLEAAILAPGTHVLLEEAASEDLPSLILKGGGDAMLMDAQDCELQCLATLADGVAALGLTEFEKVIGDDTWLPFERWGIGWSVEDLQFYYGTAISALSVNDNLVWVEVEPGDTVGGPATVRWREGDAYLSLQNELRTVEADAETDFGVERYPGSSSVRIYGHVAMGRDPIRFPLAIENPAEFAAQRFKRLLEARGIRVNGVAAHHRELTLADIPPEPDADIAPTARSEPLAPSASRPIIAMLTAAPLSDTLHRISKDSENLHADLLLRRLGKIDGTGSRRYGLVQLESLMDEAGIPDTSYALHGGSGMSIYNRISPRAMVQLLAFAARQDWFETWLADQPIGGVDGTLERRFVGTELEGRIFAKTGTLNGANALSGVMVATSGRRLLFSIFANDRPTTTGSATPEMDALLTLIAETY
jgi:D-alanyl-D-alanine carboxypeptidase/D-alanyl-D-alanine-endopeptidase (penicillin-binding protein 4)